MIKRLEPLRFDLTLSPPLEFHVDASASVCPVRLGLGLGLLVERTVKVLMAEDPVAILGGSISLKSMDDGDVHDEVAHFGVAHIGSKPLQEPSSHRGLVCCPLRLNELLGGGQNKV